MGMAEAKETVNAENKLGRGEGRFQCRSSKS